MQLDGAARSRASEVLAAFVQLRKIASWMNPNIAAQSWVVNLPAFLKGDMGMVLMGGWAQGNMLNAGATPADFSQRPRPAGQRPALLRPQRRQLHLLADQGARPAGRAEALRRSRDAALDAGDVFQDHRLHPGPHRRRTLQQDGLHRRPAQRGRRAQVDAIKPTTASCSASRTTWRSPTRSARR